jgi:hypothetical protein
VPSVISIGCQVGGSEAGFFGDLKVPLYRALTRHVTSSHCPAVDEYAVVLRVDGSLDKFGDEGLARLRFAKARRYITVDVQVPENVWCPMSKRQLQEYLAHQVKGAIALCVRRLQKDKHAVAEKELFMEVEAAINEYLAEKKDD